MTLAPTVSLVVPVYRTEPYLGDCLTSLLQQTVASIEIIVVDDGSPGDVAAIVTSCSAGDPRVRLIRHATNQGVLVARLTGARQARGSYLSFIDSDDWVEDRFVDRLLTAAQESDADLVQCAMLEHQGGGQVAVWNRGAASHRTAGAAIMGELLAGGMFNSLANKLIRAECFLAATESLTAEERKIDFGEDLLCLFRICMRSDRYSHIEDPLYHYVRRDGSALAAAVGAVSRHRVDALRQVYRSLTPMLLASFQPAHLKERFVEREFLSAARALLPYDSLQGFRIELSDGVSAEPEQDRWTAPRKGSAPAPAGRLRLCLLQPDCDVASVEQDWADLSGRLCEIAAAEGHDVVHVAVGESRIRLITRIGATVCPLAPLPQVVVGVPAAQAAYIAFEWLRTENFDVVCAPTSDGLLSYALTARHQDLCLQATTFCVAAGGPSLLSRHLAGEMPRGIDDLVHDALERRALALADLCLFLDPRAEAWVAQQGWTVPGLRGGAAFAGDADAAAKATWPELLNMVRRRRVGPAAAVAAEASLVSVCIPHFNRPTLVRQAIESIRRQTYDRVEIVVVDDASTAPEAKAALDGLEADLVRQGGMLVRHDTNRDLGAARNTAARHARGVFLLFLDADDYAKPEQIATLVNVARATGADIVNSFCDRMQNDRAPEPDQWAEERWLALGNAPTVGMFQNLFGSPSALFRKSSFLQLGGYIENRGVPCEDWEIFARASLAGMNLQTVPQALYWYRLTPNCVIQTTGAYAGSARVLATYFAHASPLLRPVLQFAHGATVQLQRTAVQLQMMQNSLRHCETALNHRDAHIAHLETDVRCLNQRLAVMQGEVSELRAVCSIMLAGYGPTPQAAVDAVLHSRSWRATRALRGLVGRLCGQRPAESLEVTSWVYAASVISALHQSTTWELAGPLRALTRLIRRR